jgi:hypothetical protein
LKLRDPFTERKPMPSGYLDHEVAQAPWMSGQAGDDPGAAGRALLMQFIDAGDADVGGGGGVDARGRGPHQCQPHSISPQQYQAHFGLVHLDLEPKHLTQERGGGRKIVHLQVGPTAQELSHRHMLLPPGPPASAHLRRYARFSAVRGPRSASRRTGILGLGGGVVTVVSLPVKAGASRLARHSR